MTARLRGPDLARIRRLGLVPLSAEQGLALFDAAVGSGPAHVLAVRLDRAALRTRAGAGELTPLLRDLVPAAPAAARPRALPFADGEPAERERALVELVRAEVATVLGHDSAAAVEPTRAFKDIGLDSLAAVELRNRLRGATGLELDATVVFEHRTCAALAAHLAGRRSASPAA
jgi:acyl carrier protein